MPNTLTNLRGNHHLVPLPIQGVLALDDTKPAEAAPVATVGAQCSEDELAKLGFPEQQGDMAPSAMVP